MIGNCHSCHYENLEVETYQRHSLKAYGESWLLCKICANTFISNASDYQHYENITLYQSLGWIGNYLAELIKEKR